MDEDGKKNQDEIVSISKFKVVFLLVMSISLVAVGFLVYAEFIKADNDYVPSGYIDFEGFSNSPKEVKNNITFRMAIAPVISPLKSLEKYGDLAAYIARELGRDLELIQRRTYAEINEIVRNNRCDVAMVCTYPFVRGEREFGMEALVVPVIDDKITYHSYIIVPSASSVDSLIALKDLSFASADLISNSGWLFPAVWLLKNNYNPDSFFGDHVITGSHDKSIYAVANGLVDGAAVDSIVYDQLYAESPLVRNNTRVVMKSPPFGTSPLVIPKEVEPELKAMLREILVSMDKDDRGREILSYIGVQKYVVPESSLYSSVRESVRYYESKLKENR